MACTQVINQRPYSTWIYIRCWKRKLSSDFNDSIAKKQGTCRRNPRENTWHDWRLSPLNDYATSTWGFLKRNLHFLGFFFRFHVGFNKVPVFLIWNQHHIPCTWIFCLKATKACPRCKLNKFNNPSDLQLPSPKNVNVKIHCVLPSIYQHKPHVIHQLLTIKQWFKKNMVRTRKKT